MNPPTLGGHASSRMLLIMLLATAGVSTLPLHAQDSHYWNIAYGTQATLLGGAVIGSASDLSATYYNPGILAINRNAGLLIGASIYKLQIISVEGGENRNTSQSTVQAAPGLVAGRISVDSTVLSGVAYSILGRQYFSSEISSRFSGTADVFQTPGIRQQVTTEIAFGTRLTETWLGISAFRLLPPTVGIGLTNYIAIRNQSIRSSMTGSVIPEGGKLTTATRISDLDYSNIRLLWKFGVGLDFGNLTLGATVTTPSIGIWGSGSSYFNRTFSGYAHASDTNRTEQLLGTNQEDLSSRFLSSWAIGFGAGYRIADLRLHFSAEWYAPVSGFDILPTAPFTGQSDGQVYTNPVTFEMASVFNMGLGMEYTLSPKTTLYGSVTTDFSGIKEGTTNTVSTTAWDLYHISAGAMLSFAPFDITIGISYAGGSETLSNIPWTRRPLGNDSLFGLPGDTRIRSTSLTGILALSFRL